MTNKMRSKTNNNTDLVISLWSQRLRPEDWDFKASLFVTARNNNDI